MSQRRAALRQHGRNSATYKDSNRSVRAAVRRDRRGELQRDWLVVHPGCGCCPAYLAPTLVGGATPTSRGRRWWPQARPCSDPPGEGGPTAAAVPGPPSLAPGVRESRRGETATEAARRGRGLTA